MSTAFIQYIQSFHTPFLDLLFQHITFLGEEPFILLFFTVLYWTVDKRMARFIGASFFISLCVNTGLKELLHLPRPIGMEGIRSLRISTATGYSFPSGHTQAVASIFSSVSIYLKKRWVTSASIIVIVLVGFSRLYLGVHWPADVLGGILLALIISLFTYYAFTKGSVDPLLTGALLIGVIPLFILADPAYSKAFGLLCGYALGIHLETRHIHFETRATLWKQFIRIFLGLTGLLLIKEGVKPLLPPHHLSDALRYGLMGLYGMALVPWLIKRLKL